MGKTEELLERCTNCTDYPTECGIYVHLALSQLECKFFKPRPNMLKYLYSSVTFQEVPDEVSLCISISGCPNRCFGCHSPELWSDEGTNLTYHELEKLIEGNPGITCVCFMGGDANPSLIYGLAKYVKTNHKLKTCWYSGRNFLLPKLQLLAFDYLKQGPYEKDLGGLESPTTNQRFYKVLPNGGLEDITSKFYTKE